jgi:type IV pilus assembly protein PilE
VAYQFKRGFTLIELTIALCMVAILLTIALPAYQRQLWETRRHLAGAELFEVMIRQEQFFIENKRFAQALTDLAYPEQPYAIDRKGSVVSAEAQNRIYLIELATLANAYTIYAVPQLDQAGDDNCGTLSLNSIGIKKASGAGGGQACW